MKKNTRSHFLPLLAVLASVSSLTAGTSLAKQLFPMLGAQGASALRVGLAAIILVLIWRPWRWPLRSDQLWTLMQFGLALALMNLLIYMALRTIAFGVAVAIEFAGPLAVAIYYSRRPVDFVWLILAAVGLVLVLPWSTISREESAGLDPMGLACAAGSAICWALYIVLGRRLGGIPSGQAASLGMLFAAMVVVPAGLAEAGARLVDPSILLFGLLVAIVSSALPYSLEMFALRRLPPATFGIALATEPAVAAFMGMALLNEHLSRCQWLAIFCIICAAMGSAITRPHPAAEGPTPSASDH